MTTDYLVISTSLNPESKSRILARNAYAILNEGGKAQLIDLVDFTLPLCDGMNAYNDKHVKTLSGKISSASAILLAVPVYNYAGSAAAKNLIELTGRAWSDKVVGFLCAAGGRSSYMSIMNLANSLMLDFRCLINPRFVYAEGSAFKAGEIADLEIQKRINELCVSTVRLTERVASSTCS